MRLIPAWVPAAAAVSAAAPPSAAAGHGGLRTPSLGAHTGCPAHQDPPGTRLQEGKEEDEVEEDSTGLKI